MARFSVCAVLVVALGFAGCGSSKKSPTAPTPSGGSGFLERADVACIQRATDNLPGNEQAAQAKSPQEAATAYQSFVQADKKALATLSSLTPPSDKQASFASYVQIIRQITSLDQQQVSAVRTDNRQQNAAINAHEQVLRTRGHALAGKIGLLSCAGQLQAADVTAIRSLINRISTTHPASLCTTAFTANYLKVAFQPGGNVNACVRQQKAPASARSVDVTEIQGAGPVASAVAALHGGAANGKKASLTLVKQSGQWKADILQLTQ